MASGVITLPISCKIPALWISLHLALSYPISCANIMEYWATRCECPPVYESRCSISSMNDKRVFS